MIHPRVKICGLRDAMHALAAADAGADMLGFVFVDGVRRQLQPHQGTDIIAEYRAARGPGGPRLVGLFRNQSVAWVNGVVQKLGLDLAQLCGDETQEYAEQLSVPAIKRVPVRPGADTDTLAEQVTQALSGHEMAVLDRYDPDAPGGTGKTFDWAVAKGVAQINGVLLAGGLNPGNVADAVRLIRPWGVDVSSGVETGGEKDPAKIRAFVQAARS